jgi:hypothetical protein
MMSAAFRETPGRRWRLAFVYGFGVWSALTLWTAADPYLFSGSRDSLGKLPSLDWVFVVNTISATVCLLGFRAGLDSIARIDRRPARNGSSLFAFGFGLIFPVTGAVLKPVFGLFRAGLMPALVWAFVGSVLVALLFGRIARS